VAVDKKTFLKLVTVLCDTREQRNEHILNRLDELKIKHETRKLDYGDYSFKAGDKDFSMSCAIEKKADVDELYTNIMEGERGKKGERLQREFDRANRLSKSFSLLIENCGSEHEFKSYIVPAWKMKAQKRKRADVGQACFDVIDTWRVGNRYNFDVIYVKDPSDTADVMLERFYRYWRNYSTLVGLGKYI
jgi:ERCC4-type nuclease